MTGVFLSMKEHLNVSIKPEIKWPQGNTVEVGPHVDFVYIMRKDEKFTMEPIARRITDDTHSDGAWEKSILMEEYDTFVSKLIDVLRWGYSSKGTVEIHLYNPDRLEKSIREKSSGSPIISLDPLMSAGVYQHKVSRGYYLGGRKDFGQVSRPGSEPLGNQAKNISANVSDIPVCVSEDDIFSGGSVIASLNGLLHAGVSIKNIIPGIQIGKPDRLTEMGIPVNPIIEYKTEDTTDIFNKVDLGDPRDYLLGASGLVVKLPNGKLGRAPYILPFVSTAARAGIPRETEKDFALKVLQINHEFFYSIQQKYGFPVLLKHMDPNFVTYMSELYGIDSNADMVQMTVWAMDNIDRLWEFTRGQGEIQEKLESLNLPRNVIFIDVNGTLFPDDSPDGYIPENDISALKEKTETLSSKGIAVGLCSDSPLPQLINLAENLGFTGPILAENGNLLHYGEKTLILHSLENRDKLLARIQSVASDFHYHQINDCIAPEFGGEIIDYNGIDWGFGANRTTSVTVFGPQPLIKKLGNYFGSEPRDYSIDCSPEFNYFAIHPGDNYKLNKGRVLRLLSRFGHDIVMIGNSMSDWVDPESGVICTFVGQARLSNAILNKVRFVSEKPVIKGVIDILEKII